MNIVGYVRVSTNQQRDSGLGIDHQIQEIYNYASKIPDATVTIFKDDGVSGSLSFDKRYGMKQAISVLNKNSILLVLKRDRIGRDMKCLVTIEEEVKKRGSRIVSIAGEGTDTLDPSAGIIRRMFDAFAEHERVMIGIRTKAALDIKKSRNEYTGGNVPFGYTLSLDGIHVQENQEEKSTIRKIQQLHSIRMKTNKIADFLNENLLLNRHERWNYTSIRHILKKNKVI